MARLPQPGGDVDSWGNILNEYLSVEHTADGTLKSNGSIATKADDAAVVHIADDETIAGTKTFLASPVVPAPTLDGHPANKTYVDNNLASKIPTTRQVIAGSGLSGGGDLSVDRTIAVVFGATSGTVAQGNDLRLSVWGPADNGLVGWVFDSALANAINPPTASGTAQFAKIKVPQATTVINIVMTVSTGGSGFTVGQSFAALYSPTGALQAATADQSVAWATGGTKTMPLSTPQAVTSGNYYVLFWAVATALPQFRSGASSSVVNAGLATAASRFGTANTGLTTTPPPTIGTISAGTISWWVGLS